MEELVRAVQGMLWPGQPLPAEVNLETKQAQESGYFDGGPGKLRNRR